MAVTTANSASGSKVTGSSGTTFTVDWSGSFTPTAGSTLVFFLAVSANATLAEDSGTWTLEEQYNGSILSGYLWYKENCSASDTSITINRPFNFTAPWCVIEASGAKTSGAVDANGSAEDVNYVATTTNTITTGTTGTRSTANGRAYGFVMIDLFSNWDSNTGSWSGSWSEVVSGNIGTTAGLRVAELAVSSTAAQSGTYSGWTDANDECYGAIIIIDEASGGATTVTLAQASESDSVQAITSRKIKAFDQATEANSAGILTPQLVGGEIVVAVNQVTETDEATRFTKAKNKQHNGPALETDTAQPIASRKIKAFGQTSETDFAQAISFPGVKRVTVNQASETDAVQAIARIKRKAFGQVSETDLSQAVTKRKIKALGQNLEIDSAAPITFVGTKYILLGQVVETDFAQPILAPSLTPPAVSGGGGGWPFQVPYLKSELEKLDKKSAKRKAEKDKPSKPVRDSLLEAIAQTLPEPAKEQEPIAVIKPVEVAKPAPVAAPQPAVQDLSADIAQLAKSIQMMQVQIMELTQATISMQLQLQQGLEDIEALTLIGATMGDL